MAKDTAWSTAARRAIGMQLIGKSRAAYEVAAELAADPSNTSRTLKHLRDAYGAVVTAPGPDGQPRYELAEDQRELLLSAIGVAQPQGTLVRGQQILMVTVDDDQEGVFADALRTSARTGEVVWAARTDGSSQYLIVSDRDADILATLRLAAVLKNAGLQSRRIVVEEIMSADELRRAAAALRLQTRQ